MRKLYITFLLLISFLSMLEAQDTKYPLFEKGVYPSKNGNLNYRLLKPENYNPEKKYPIVLFLHGAGERGSDNEITLTHIAGLFLDKKNRKDYPCFVLVPQCPKGKRWVEVDWTLKTHEQPESPSWAMRRVVKVLEILQKKHNIDKSRIYITGLSMGGFGTWDMLMRYPKIFAAGIPICGGADETKAENIKDIPIWTFHGDLDQTIKAERSRNIVKALRKIGGKITYTEYKGVAHPSWKPAYKEKNLLAWLFSKNKL